MNYKTLIIIPLLILLFSFICFIHISQTGINLDIDLKGGTQLVIDTQESVDIRNFENILSDFNPNIRQAKGITGYTVIIELDPSVSATAVLNKLKDSGYSFEKYSEQTVGPALGSSFFQQAQIALLCAFIFMSIVVFVIFRNPLPSIYVIIVAVVDIMEAFVFSQLLGIKLSLATFAALLLLIGYSVDSDVLLTTRVLKTKEGELSERVKGAMKTGLTMTITTIVAVFVLYFATTSVVIQQIAAVLLIGLIFDILNTWLFNAPILRWYIEKKEKNLFK